MQNNGKVSLFSIASGKGNDLALLNVLSSFNKGILVYAKSDEEIEETLTNLIKSIRNPIGKNIITTIIPHNDSTTVKLYPQRLHCHDLYEHMNYEIFGSINSLNDFNIFFQGRYYDKWLDIKQKISFENAHQDDSLQQECATHKVFDYYSPLPKQWKHKILKQSQTYPCPHTNTCSFSLTCILLPAPNKNIAYYAPKD